MLARVWTGLKLLVSCQCNPNLIKFRCHLMEFFLLPFSYVSWSLSTVVSLETAFVPLKN